MATRPPNDTQSRSGAAGTAESEPPPPAATPTTGWDRFWQVVSSGLFFMIIGTAFLAFATISIGRIHAGMTFIFFVVVGVAIVLYGTGTQATGSFDGGAPDTTFKLSLAGGAGALAFAAAAGIVFFQNDINQAFREETRFLNVSIRVNTGAATVLQHFLFDGEVDGKPVAMMIEDKDSVVAIVPYTLRDKKKEIMLRARWADPLTKPPELVNPSVEVGPIEIDVASRQTGPAGLFRLELEEEEVALNLVRDNYYNVGAPQVLVAANDSITDLRNKATDLKNAPPPVAIQPQ
jgi:hypothetical protein